jgi:UDP-N-acetylglucosamine transferase subunit ALG13
MECTNGSEGSGSILDAKRLGTAMIVVPNTSLAGNHQVEVAEYVVEKDWGVYADLKYVAYWQSHLVEHFF